jgi:hypothetical protein
MQIPRKLAAVAILFAAPLIISACGGSGSSSPPPAPLPEPDTTAPTVSAVQAPAATVDRVVTLTVTASDNVGVTAVRFLVDGSLLGSDDTAPYSIEWDTSGVTEGDHTLTAEADDAAGNIGTSAATVVAVQNVRSFAIAASGQEEVPANDSLKCRQMTVSQRHRQRYPPISRRVRFKAI